MRSLFSIIAVLILLGSVLSVPITFRHRLVNVQRSVKTRLKEGVSKSDLHTFCFESESAIRWTRPNKEFQHGGHLYDVVHDESTSSSIQYKCIRDDEETRLFADLGVEVGKKLNQHHSSLIVHTSHWLSLHYLEVESTKLYLQFPLSTTQKVGENNRFMKCNASLKVEIPPPIFS